MKSPLKKKASHCKTKSPEKLPYEKSKEESKAVAQKYLDNLWQSVAESIAKKKELMKNPPKPHYIAQQELRKKVIEVDKKQHHKKILNNWWKSLEESRARRLELQKNLPKPHYIA